MRCRSGAWGGNWGKLGKLGVSVQILTHPLSLCCLDCADCRAPSHDRMLPGIQHEPSAPLNLDSPPVSICQDLHTDAYSTYAQLCRMTAEPFVPWPTATTAPSLRAVMPIRLSTPLG